MCSATEYFPKWAWDFVIMGHFAVGSLFTVILYIKIAWIAWFKSSRNTIQVDQTINMVHKQRQQRQILQLMGTILGVYFLLYLPPACVQIMVKPRTDDWYYWLRYSAWFIYFFNAVVNPFIYALKNKEFAKAFRQILNMKEKTPSLLVAVTTAVTILNFT